MNPMNTDAGAINPAMPQNEVAANKFKNHNTFPMSYNHYLTSRYGDVTPFYVFDAWAEDKVPFASFHELRNYTMSSPLMSNIKMYKDYFLVPYKAILPRTWDLIIANPTQGDDVPDDAICVTNRIITGVVSLLERPYQLMQVSDMIDTSDILTSSLKGVFVAENLISDGGLLSMLGCKLGKYFKFESNLTRSKDIFNRFYNDLYEIFTGGDYTIAVTYPTNDTSRWYTFQEGMSLADFRKQLDMMRNNSDFKINIVGGNTSDLDIDLSNTFNRLTSVSASNLGVFPINLSRLVAYQLSYFHFMTNDKVDFIYSADLYRNMMQSILYSDSEERTLSLPTFDYNGVNYQYDVFSGHNLDYALNIASDLENVPGNFEINNRKIAFLLELTSFRRSLKFGDYFTGARPRPLAVGDVTAPVVNNGVSAIDITKNIAAQRFLNAVEKTGRKISEYSRKILGGYVQPVSTDPKFLARDSVMIGQQEVENTGEEQGNVVTLLRSQQSKYAFEAEVSEPAIILGVSSFEVERSYCRTIDRHFFHKDRFDMFNSYFQNIGDQEIYRAEKGFGDKTPFAYTLRHMEYKQRYSIASGGFVYNLPSWSFISDNEEQELSQPEYDFISPDFIRSSPSEFDRFYSSLTGLCLDDYFHFIIKFDNQSTPIRNMEFNPTIL